MEKLGCLITGESMEISEAANNYDDDYCKVTCPHHDICSALKKGGSDDSRRDRERAPR